VALGQAISSSRDQMYRKLSAYACRDPAVRTAITSGVTPGIDLKAPALPDVKAKINLERLDAGNPALMAAVESCAGRAVLILLLKMVSRWSTVDGNCNSTSQEADRISG
jgi:hypothetical protein